MPDLFSQSFLFAVIALAGCAANFDIDRPHHPATTTSAEIDLATAQPLDKLQTSGVQVNFTDKLTRPQTTKTVYFGEADEFDSDDDQTPLSAIPIIGIKVASEWKAVALVGPGLVNAGWKYVGAGPHPREVWGVLDTSAGDSRSNFVVAHSTDGAMTFSLKVFHKPCKLATVSDFAMSRTGKGRVTLSLDADCGKNKAGLYHYETADDGKTWSSPPRYEPDAMIRADTVPDDEQPDQVDPPTRTLFVPSHRRTSR